MAESPFMDKPVSTSQVTVDPDEKVAGSAEANLVIENKARVDADASSSPKTLTEPSAVGAPEITSSNVDTATIEPTPTIVFNCARDSVPISSVYITPALITFTIHT